MVIEVDLSIKTLAIEDKDLEDDTKQELIVTVVKIENITVGY